MVRRLFLFLVGTAAALALFCLGLETLPGNPAGAFLVFVGLAYCFGGALYLAYERNRAALAREVGDRSLWWLVPGFLGVFFGPPLEYLELPESLPRTGLLEALGVACLAGGLGLRLWTRRALGRMYSGRLQIQPQHRFVQAGPYRWVRHPGYLGFLLIALGLSLGYSSLIGLSSTFFLLVPAFAYRMRVEERLLLEAFGEAFQQYRRRTWRLVPGLW